MKSVSSFSSIDVYFYASNGIVNKSPIGKEKKPFLNQIHFHDISSITVFFSRTRIENSFEIIH